MVTAATLQALPVAGQPNKYPAPASIMLQRVLLLPFRYHWYLSLAAGLDCGIGAQGGRALVETTMPFWIVATWGQSLSLVACMLAAAANRVCRRWSPMVLAAAVARMKFDINLNAHQLS